MCVCVFFVFFWWLLFWYTSSMTIQYILFFSSNKLRNLIDDYELGLVMNGSILNELTSF